MKYKRSVYRTFALITQLGLSMITPIFLCVFLAVFLEKKFSISLFIPLVIMGVLAGRCLLRLVSGSELQRHSV